MLIYKVYGFIGFKWTLLIEKYNIFLLNLYWIRGAQAIIMFDNRTYFEKPTVT
jgi:hypothetical protein